MKPVPVQAPGFTLIESLIALAAAATLLLAATAWLQATGRQTRETRTRLELVDAATFSLDLLERAVRSAGAYGAASANSAAAGMVGVQALGTPDPPSSPVGGRCVGSLAHDLAHPVQWQLWTGSSPWPLACAASPEGRAMPGSALLVVRRAVNPMTRSDGGALWLESVPGSVRLQPPAAPALLDAWPTTTPTATPLTTPLHSRLEVEAYYVSRDSTGVRGQPSLRRKRLVGGSTGPRFEDEELVAGVSRLLVVPVPSPAAANRLLELRVEIFSPRQPTASWSARRFVWIRNGMASPWP